MHLSGTSNAVIGAILALGVLSGVAFIGIKYVLSPPLAAAEEAYRAALAGRTPAKYFGIKPEWVCVYSLKGADPDSVPVQGGDLSPDMPYLMLGDAGGDVVLWRAQGQWAGSVRVSMRDDQTLKLPLSKLRVVPTDTPRKRCVDEGG